VLLVGVLWYTSTRWLKSCRDTRARRRAGADAVVAYRHRHGRQGWHPGRPGRERRPAAGRRVQWHRPARGGREGYCRQHRLACLRAAIRVRAASSRAEAGLAGIRDQVADADRRGSVRRVRGSQLPGVGVTADQEHGGIVAKLLAGVADDVGVQLLECVFEVRSAEQGGAWLDGVEHAVPIARLADPIGIEQDALAGVKVESSGLPWARAQLCEAERQAGFGRFDELGGGTAEQQRRRAAAAEDLDLRLAVGDLSEHRGHELLGGPVALQAGLNSGADAAADA
jgi:hypothetical protein